MRPEAPQKGVSALTIATSTLSCARSSAVDSPVKPATMPTTSTVSDPVSDGSGGKETERFQKQFSMGSDPQALAWQSRFNPVRVRLPVLRGAGADWPF